MIMINFVNEGQKSMINELKEKICEVARKIMIPKLKNV